MVKALEHPKFPNPRPPLRNSSNPHSNLRKSCSRSLQALNAFQEMDAQRRAHMEQMQCQQSQKQRSPDSNLNVDVLCWKLSCCTASSQGNTPHTSKSSLPSSISRRSVAYPHLEKAPYWQNLSSPKPYYYSQCQSEPRLAVA